MKTAAILYALLIILALTSWPGTIIAAAWIAGGLYMVANSQSRGWKADAAFVVTWPIHWIMER